MYCAKAARRLRRLLKLLITWTSGEAYQPGPTTAGQNRNRRRHHNDTHIGDVRYRFHNVHGLSENKFRSYYLARARMTCDVLGLADGSGGTARAPGAGWGFVVVTGGDGDDDDDARELHESCGPVVCDAAAPVWLGAQRHTNNTGELTGLGESIRWLLESDPDKTQPVLLRPDSEYSVGVLTGRVDAEENAELVEQVRTLLERLRAQRKGRVGWSHVRGHSKHKWNDRADALADEGRTLSLDHARATGRGWARVHEWPSNLRTKTMVAAPARAALHIMRTPTHIVASLSAETLPNARTWRFASGHRPGDLTALSPHAISVIDRILRAEPYGPYGVLNLLAVRQTATAIDKAHEETLAALDAAVPGHMQVHVEQARAAVTSAHARLTQGSTRAATRSAQHIKEPPITHTVTCPIDVAALTAFLQTPEASQRIKAPGPGGNHVSLGTLARQFLRKVQRKSQTDGEILIEYRLSPKGWAYMQAGHLTLTREYAVGADPFGLPKHLRHLALARFGYDFDDSGAFSRAGAHLIPVGRPECKRFLEHRETILAAIGRHFFPTESAAEQRSRAKHLTNMLDMDGTYGGWRREYSIPATTRLDDPRIALPDESEFDMKAYIGLQSQRTEWVADHFGRMLELTKQMPDTTHPDRTTKSYLLQAYEATSREAKLRWAASAGHAWLNLQHDGVVIALAPDTSQEQATRQLTDVSSEALGYLQPVDVKTMNQDVTPQPAARGSTTRARERTAAAPAMPNSVRAADAARVRTHLQSAVEALQAPSTSNADSPPPPSALTLELLLATPGANLQHTHTLSALIAPTTSGLCATRDAWDVLMAAHRGCIYTCSNQPAGSNTEPTTMFLDRAHAG